MMEDSRKKAAALVATVSSMLIVGALVFEMLGYSACEMCMWQRWGHAAAATFATLALIAPSRWASIVLIVAVGAMAASGIVGGFHAGVEWKLWEGLTTCSTRPHHGDGDILVEIMKAPLIRCDEASWRLLGISMAGYNALISLATVAAASLMSTVGIHRNGKE